jgi:hypothetical protein
LPQALLVKAFRRLMAEQLSENGNARGLVRIVDYFKFQA